MRKKQRKKVIVAMSGGIDSSATVALLKNQGFDIQGIYFKFLNNNNKDVDKVEKIAKFFGIPLKVMDVSKKFKETVIEYFLDELEAGNTPNPCVVCNKEMKFKILLKEMKKMKADYIATGHYARVQKSRDKGSKMISYKLFEAKDKKKDQSYFLYGLTQKELSKIIFPLGNYTKLEIRELIRKSGLSIHGEEESQDICFIPFGGYEEFLKANLKFKKGKIVDLKGKVLGIHEGLPLYTIGQRKGIKIGGNGPFYVIQKDSRKNKLLVTNKKEDLELFGKKISIKNTNWLKYKVKFPLKTFVRTRYRSCPVYAIINNKEVIFKESQKSITPGQSAVFYSRSGEVLGGGIIK